VAIPLETAPLMKNINVFLLESVEMLRNKEIAYEISPLKNFFKYS